MRLPKAFSTTVAGLSLHMILVIQGQSTDGTIGKHYCSILTLYKLLDGLPGFARIPKRKINQEFKKICDPSRIRTPDLLLYNRIF